MPKKALILKFTDAILWNGGMTGDSCARYYPPVDKQHPKNYKYRHYTYPIGTVCYHAVNNMLHVLCGERPYSTLWYKEQTGLEPQYIPEIEEAARSSFIRIETPTKKGYDIVTNTSSTVYVDEIYTTKKPSEESWMKTEYCLSIGGVQRKVIGEFPTWELMYQFLGHETFDKLIEITETITKNPWHDISFSKFLEIHGADPRLIAFAKKLPDEVPGTMPLCLLITGQALTPNKNGKIPDYEAKFGMQSPKAGVPMTYLRLNPKGIEQGVPHRGTIIVPLTDYLVKKISKGPGCATIFDGGVVSIAEYRDYSPMLVSEFQGVQIGMPAESNEEISHRRSDERKAAKAAEAAAKEAEGD